ncbi:MAG TPA: VOC family protein [Chloroflexota bacterium]|jgi:catechol 2,3-dioxygenase-like lactoylglutathione lyase family enzyme
MQATIRYLAIVSDDPERLARFYATTFGLRELGRSSAGDVSLTDGFYNLSLLAARPELGATGPRQIGIAVDDKAALKDRLQRYAPDVALAPDEGGLHHGEYCVADPNGFAVSVSTRNFGVPDGTSALPAVRHVAMCEPRGDVVADFFANVFGLEKAFLHQWRPTGRFMTDGTINLALLADAEEMRAAGRPVTVDHFKQGLTHYGFETPRVGAFVDQLPTDTRREQRLDRRDAADYYRIWDPDGNHFDLRVAGAWSDDG